MKMAEEKGQCFRRDADTFAVGHGVVSQPSMHSLCLFSSFFSSFCLPARLSLSFPLFCFLSALLSVSFSFRFSTFLSRILSVYCSFRLSIILSRSLSRSLSPSVSLLLPPLLLVILLLSVHQRTRSSRRALSGSRRGSSVAGSLSAAAESVLRAASPCSSCVCRIWRLASSVVVAICVRSVSVTVNG